MTNPRDPEKQQRQTRKRKAVQESKVTLRELQETQQEIQRQRKLEQQEEEDQKKMYFEIPWDEASDECKLWWDKLVRYYEIQNTSKVDIWMKDLFLPW